jgi:sugar lactone lactonase YvrE
MFMCSTSEMGMSTSFRFKRGVLQAGFVTGAFGVLLALTGAAQAQLPAVSVYGARVQFNPPTACTPTNTYPVGKVTRDLAGNIFALVPGLSCVFEIPLSGPLQVVIPSTDASMSAAPTSIAADSSGNLYVVHNGVNIQFVPRLANGTYSLGTGETSSSPFSGITNNYYTGNDIAVDSLGNIYAASSSGNTVGTWAGKGILMYGPSTGYTPKYLLAASAYPVTVQVDPAGDVFYADGSYVYEIPAATVSSTISSGTPLTAGTKIATGVVPLSSSAMTGTAVAMATPKYLYFDPAGNLYVGNGTSADYVIVNSSTGFSATSPVYFLPGNYYTGSANGSNGPIIGHAAYTFGAVDNQGNLILAYNGALEYYGSGRLYIDSGQTYVGGVFAVAAAAVSGTTVPSGASFGLLFNATTTLATPIGSAFVVNADGSAYGGASTAESTFNTGSNTTCAAGATYTAGQSCLVEVGYGAHYPGYFATAFNVYNGSGSLLTTIYTNGIATGPAATVDTGVATLTSTAFTSPLGVAVDNAGNIYVADPGAGKVYKYAAGATTGAAITGTFTTPTGVAIDAGGNLFVVDAGTNTVSYFANNYNGTAFALGTQTTLTTTGYTLDSPHGIAVDSYGSIYIADGGNQRVLLVPNPLMSGVGKIVTVGSGFNMPYGVAVDAYQNVYVADKGAGKVYEVPGGYGLTLSGSTNPGPGAITTVGSFNSPTGVAVDGSGTVYVADSTLPQITKVAYTGGAFSTQTALYTATGVSAPAGVAVDRTGDLYFTDSDQPALYFGQRSEASGSAKVTLPLPDATTTGTTTANLILSNAGLSTALTETAAITPAASYSITNNGCNGASVAAGASCTDVITFAGSSAASADTNVAGTLTFTDNQLNATTQTAPVTLSALATGGVSTVTIAGDTSVIYGADETYTVKALDSGSKPSAAANESCSVALAPQPSGTTLTTSVTLVDGAGSFLLPTALTNVGNYNLSTACSNGTTNVSSNTIAVAVGKAPLVAYATSASRYFDTVNPLFTYTLIGLVNGDNASVVSGTASAATAATRVSAAGTYTLTPSGTLSASNYSVSYEAAPFTVLGSAPQSIVFTPLPPLTHAVAYTLTGFSTSGLPLSYTATNASISGNVLTPTAAGTVTVTAFQVGNGSYAPATPVSRTFTAQ